MRFPKIDWRLQLMSLVLLYLLKINICDVVKINQPYACKHALCWPRQLFRTPTGQFGKKLVRYEDITSPSLTSEEANPR